MYFKIKNTLKNNVLRTRYNKGIAICSMPEEGWWVYIKKKTEVANGLESAWKEKGYLQAH